MALPEKPLIAGSNQKVELAKPVFFFQRPDGTVFHTDEKAAWSIYNGRSTMVGIRQPLPVYLGTSDGKLFAKAVVESQQIFKTSGLQAAQDRIRKGIDEELEVAKLNKTPPPNTDTVDKYGRYTRL
jgi:hypothetical protein